MPKATQKAKGCNSTPNCEEAFTEVAETMMSDASPCKSATSSVENSGTSSDSFINPGPSTSKAIDEPMLGEPSESRCDHSCEDGTLEQGVVNPILYKSLVSMGIDKNLSIKALICTRNRSVEEALQWIGELGAEEMEALCHDSDFSSDCSSDWEDCEEEDVYYKMVFVVNTEHGMGTGKVASQVGHAALGLYRILKEDIEKYHNSVVEWEQSGEKKITLRGQDTQELLELQTNAAKNELPTYIVKDAGRTQIPEGAVTVLGIFGDEVAVNEVTGHLKLL